MPDLISIFVLTRNDDLLVHLAVRDTDHLHAVVLDELTKPPELAAVRTSVVYGHMREKVIGPT
ncbi:Lrp/AsnC ligand binding domain-containing protein [Streptomyces sp. NPDC020794]|uniref:Lrp/AsnC ligand binding domain-containing protein n=1 Tax=unclassified Streptomyces TaxID=2593676 RepID=UPI0036E2FAB9